MKREGESDLEFFHRLKAEHAVERRQRLEEARGKGDKEEFDYERLKELLRPLIPGMPRPEELEYTYYVVCPETRTLEDFARFLQVCDEYDGGDMHLDR